MFYRPFKNLKLHNFPFLLIIFFPIMKKGLKLCLTPFITFVMRPVIINNIIREKNI